jgi:hypothetical protein
VSRARRSHRGNGCRQEFSLRPDKCATVALAFKFELLSRKPVNESFELDTEGFFAVASRTGRCRYWPRVSPRSVLHAALR